MKEHNSTEFFLSTQGFSDRKQTFNGEKTVWYRRWRATQNETHKNDFFQEYQKGVVESDDVAPQERHRHEHHREHPRGESRPEPTEEQLREEKERKSCPTPDACDGQPAVGVIQG